jgi:hypothetical protein
VWLHVGLSGLATLVLFLITVAGKGCS